MVIRPATNQDIPELLMLAETFIKESQWKYTYNKERSTDAFISYIDDPLGAAIVADDDGLHGLCLVFIGYEFFDEPCCYISKFYVRKESRGIGLGRALMRSAVKWADDNGCVDTTVTAQAHIGQDQLFINLCRKFGFREDGTALVRLCRNQ